MHLRLDAASAVIAAPSSPDGPAEACGSTQGFDLCEHPSGNWFPRFGDIAGWVDRLGTTTSDGIVTPSGVEGAIGSDGGDLLVGRDLIEWCRQHGRMAQVAGGELSGSDFERLLVKSDVELAPESVLRAAKIAGVPLTFAFDRDAGAVDQEAQGASRSPIGNVDLPCLLTTAEGAEVRHRTPSRSAAESSRRSLWSGGVPYRTAPSS